MLKKSDSVFSAAWKAKSCAVGRSLIAGLLLHLAQHPPAMGSRVLAAISNSILGAQPPLHRRLIASVFGDAVLTQVLGLLFDGLRFDPESAQLSFVLGWPAPLFCSDDAYLPPQQKKCNLFISTSLGPGENGPYNARFLCNGEEQLLARGDSTWFLYRD